MVDPSPAQPDTDAPDKVHHRPAPLMPGQSYAKVSEDFKRLTVDRPPGWGMTPGLLLGMVLINLFLVTLIYLFAAGIGIFGNENTVAWAFPIINFIWWIGIAHAGTFISTILMLVRQEWRASINRFAEAMTLMAVTCAGLMPLIHLGRPFLFYWLFPYPNTMGLWPQWQSPLIWDVWAVMTYMLVSLLFWYLAVIPDVATIRDRATNTFVKKIYGIFALGWRGSSHHWQRFRQAYLLIGGIAVPLVLSVHSIVGLDLSVGITPGWHSTVIPPYFLAEAFFSGFATVLMLTTVLRHFYGLHEYVTDRHLENLAKILLFTGLVLNWAFVLDYFTVWYSGSTYEITVLIHRFVGPYALPLWIKLSCCTGVLQLLWFRRIRRSPVALFIIGLLVNVGIWCEAYVLVTSSLSTTFLPSRWHVFRSTVWDWMALLGSMGLFASMWLLFTRYVPVSVIWEIRELIEKQDEGKLEYQEKLSTSDGEVGGE